MIAQVVEFVRFAGLQYVWPALAVVVTFALAILLHEFGHFIMARLSGVGIEIFSIGFGRRLWGIRRGDTDYRISAFPVGGYVKMRGIFSKETERYLEGEEKDEKDKKPGSGDEPAVGNAGISPVREPTATEPDRVSQAPPATTGLRLAQEALEDTKALRGKPWPLRVMVFAAGCGFNFLVGVAAFALVAWTGVDVDVPFPSLVGPIVEDSSLHRAGLRRGDRIVRFDGHAVATWGRTLLSHPPGIMDLVKDLMDARETTRPIPCLLVRREGDRETTQSLVLPGAKEIRNAWHKDLEPLIAPACIGGVIPFSPAHKAGIKDGDIVLAIDDRRIESYDQMREIVHASLKKPLAFRLKRNTEELTVTVTPQESPDSPTLGVIGVVPGNPERQRLQLGFLGAWQYGLRKAVELTADVAVATGGLFARFRYREMKQSLAGPLGIFGMTYVNARQGWSTFLYNMALLNIAFMVLNILPIPILDGGHILITTIETVTRRPVPARLLAGIYYVFFTLIVLLFVMVTWFDVLRFADWFGLSR